MDSFCSRTKSFVVHFLTNTNYTLHLTQQDESVHRATKKKKNNIVKQQSLDGIENASHFDHRHGQSSTAKYNVQRCRVLYERRINIMVNGRRSSIHVMIMKFFCCCFHQRATNRRIYCMCIWLAVQTFNLIWSIFLWNALNSAYKSYQKRHCNVYTVHCIVCVCVLYTGQNTHEFT